MLVTLGFLMIAVFMYLIMSRRTTPVVALILVPVAFGIAAGAGTDIGDMVMSSVEDLAPTAALLFFAITYFGIMIDVGLFDPLIRKILQLVGHDPVKLVVGTAALTAIVSLDGDGSTTFIIVTSALLPIYLRLGMSPVVLTCVAAVTNGVLNVVPWGGPTARAAAALNVSPTDVFVPMIPSMIAGILAVFVLAWLLGRSERKRIGLVHLPVGGEAGTDGTGGPAPAPAGMRGLRPAASSLDGAPVRSGGVLVGARVRQDTVEVADGATEPVPVLAHDPAASLPDRGERARPGLVWVNLALTLAVMVMLVVDLVPIPFVFMVAVGLALVVNFRHVSQQADQFRAHAGSVVSVVGMVLAAAVLTGVLSGTGMVEAMADWLIGVIPHSLGSHLAVITGLLSMPLTFLMSNDAFYFGVLPVLTETAANYGIEPVEMARAAVTGQPLHMQSPLVPAFLLLIALAKVEMGDHHRKAIWRSVVVSLVMLATGLALSVIPL
ncbi:citrate-Mg2+:H+ or citrate-Ca2+:H+ symporter, CitMHS family [Geodermatophilus siccatus]|uniref:Citrate-Mg2+:H+ or citrate-Ca2+:H+ symporter, CitMHS family n=1 Tax=Geodermatophilus siccatus TaxID=1137991 RepID=A0A1G9MN29_9ACTN|nr:citrate:proton symporter [Geodermatophilus siccatus]SDL75629.1 citrate-Mg2+:H+ or citrate-Ca2+:H+ symporter, CitMHS family [Geodermatophilus siccatus]